MKRLTIGCVLAGLALTALAWPAGAQDLQQKLAAVKQSIAANQLEVRITKSNYQKLAM